MKIKSIFLILTGTVFLFSCNEQSETETHSSKRGSDTLAQMGADKEDNSNGIFNTDEHRKSAVAEISAASESNASGTVTFEQTDNSKVKIKIDIKGLPEGTLAMHLHENGDCSAPDATSAGGHWNPTDMPHGKRGQDQFHKGDIANLEVGSDATAKLEMEIEGWTIGGPDSTNIVNKAVIIHNGADDFTSQPSGNAGKRIACGVISSEAGQIRDTAK